MSAHHAPDVDVIGHEESDADIGPLIRFAIFLTVMTTAVAILMVGFYRFLDSREAAEKAPRYPMAVGVERPLPPPPRLQTYPFDDVKALRKEEAKLLEHYQWINKDAGTVRIPIDRAIELLAERGLPHRAAPAAPAEAAPAPVAAPAPAPAAH